MSDRTKVNFVLNGLNNINAVDINMKIKLIIRI